MQVERGMLLFWLFVLLGYERYLLTCPPPSPKVAFGALNLLFHFLRVS